MSTRVTVGSEMVTDAPEIERLSEMRRSATEDLIDAELALGRHDEQIPELERLAARYPLRERLHGQLMLALYRAGRQAEALSAYLRSRSALDSELGVEPSPSVERLQRQILLQDQSLDVHGEPLRGYRVLGRVGSGPPRTEAQPKDRHGRVITARFPSGKP